LFSDSLKMRSKEEVLNFNPCLGVYSGEASQISGNVLTEFVKVTIEAAGMQDKFHVIESYIETPFLEKGRMNKYWLKEVSAFRFSKDLVLFTPTIDGHCLLVLVIRVEKKNNSV
jgi:hypothetical protein